MSEIKTHWAEVDAQGRLVLEPDVTARYGLRPGARVRLDLDSNTVRMHRPVTHLAKLYICLLYTSDAADERSSVDLGGRRIIKKKTKKSCTRQTTESVSRNK